LVILNDKPWNIEAPAHLLDQNITLNSSIFIRNNYKTPKEINPKTWILTIDRESVKSKKTYTNSEIKSKFKQHTYQLTLECSGNGRREFYPTAKGNQWIIGPLHCAL
jgi:DMSO/TMAO reductase YedYZ molybdopterin-dependent catalytic subunit